MEDEPNTRAPNLTEKLASCLIALGLVEREAAKALTAKEIVSLFDCDHYPIHRALGGSNHPTNLVMRIRAGHKIKTAKIDIPMIAKVKRGAKKTEEFRARMLAKQAGEVVAVEKQKRKFPKRKMPKCNRPMAGSIASGKKHKFNGKWETRPCRT